MSETRGLNTVALSDRPLIVCDVDEVVLEFVTPFGAFLNANDFELLPRSFHLTGNILSKSSGAEASSDEVRGLLDGFFAEQMKWQSPTMGAVQALSNVSAYADVVFLTSMPTRHYDQRRNLLNSHDLAYPLIATEQSKGPVIGELHSERGQPVFFIDDLIHNLHSVKKHISDVRMVHFMANDEFRAMAPPMGEDILAAEDWLHIESIIVEQIGRDETTNGLE